VRAGVRFPTRSSRQPGRRKGRLGAEATKLSAFQNENGRHHERFCYRNCSGLVAVTISAPANALPGPMSGSNLQSLVFTNVEPVVVVRRGGAVARGPRGGAAAVGRTTVVRPGYRPGVRPGVRPGRWVRPAYRWRPGGAIAAGAAIGFVAAVTAAAWAGAPPAPGSAGTTPIPAGPRASGMSARKFKSRGQFPCANNLVGRKSLIKRSDFMRRSYVAAEAKDTSLIRERRQTG
jgi:hypothetical protein